MSFIDHARGRIKKWLINKNNSPDLKDVNSAVLEQQIEVTEEEASPPAQRSRPLHSIEELEETLEKCASMDTELERIDTLSHCHFADPSLLAMPSDPFSPEYDKAVLDLYLRLARRATYDAATCEKIPIDIDAAILRPSIFHNSGEFLGNFVEAQGQIVKHLDVKPGMRVLEYGPGDGQISLLLARFGCDVTVVDIEDSYLKIIDGQAQRLGCRIKSVHGDFLTIPEGGKFDRIFFFEAFHHSLVHKKAVEQLRGMLRPGGFIAFVAEPIIDPNGYWRDAVPYAWGPRLDGLSLRAIRTHGWMELGFQEPYFLELLRRSGFSVEKKEATTNGLSISYIARPG